jgi:hypothetical protein
MTASTLFTLLALSLVSLCRADVIFHLAHSWAFPGMDSRSMILQDIPGSEVQGSRPAALRARTIVTSISQPHFYPSIENDTTPDSPRANTQQTPITSRGSSEFLQVASPDIADRETLLNLAKASWDAYHPIPTPDKWYDIHGLNWVRSATNM